MPSTATQRLRLQYAIGAGLIIGLVCVALWWIDLFAVARLRLNDTYFIRNEMSENIVIIAMDEASLERYGRTPSQWSRTVYVDLITQLQDASPRVLAFDLLFSDIEAQDEAFGDALREIRASDARTRIVLATAGIENISQATLTEGDTPTAQFTFRETLALSPVIADSADYLGYTNTIPDVDSVVRRQPTLIKSGDNSGYSFSVATYLAYLRIPASASAQVISLDNDVLNITNERQVPIDDFGFWQLNFFGQPSTAEQSTFPVISLVDVIDGTVDLSIFEDKVVLVGLMNTTGLLDQYLAPSSTNGTLMAGVEIQAHAVETIIRNSFPSGGTPALHISILMITSLLSSLILALPRWYWKALLFVGLLFIGFVIASAVFSSSETMLSLFDIALAITLSFLVALGIDITSEQRERQRIEALLTSVQNIAEQQLNLDQAATYILTDIRQLFPIADISLYLQQQNEANITYSFRQKTASSKLTSQVLSGMIDLSYIKAQESFPIRWQQKVQGYITVEQDQARAHNSSQYLTALLEQLAPHIANLLLYSAVENQRSLLDAVVNETPTILVVTQTDGTIIEHNDDLLKIIDSSNTDDFKGRDLVQLLGQVVQGDQFAQHIQDYFAQHQLFQLQELKIGDDVYNLSAAPLPSGERWVIVLNDVTSIAELSALKTQMLRIAAHDLKNPLSRIMGFGELLELQLEETLDKRQARYLSYILSGSQEMLDIITDILNLERLRSSKLSLKSVNLVKLVDEVCSSYQPDYIQKQQTFRSYLPEMPVHVNADLGQLSQAISNLIGNAIKYTPNEGHITVRVSADAMMVRFEVEDTGYGIPEDAQAKLFTEFYRAKTEQTADISGTGLGLSLVKSVITAHDGEVGFKSKEGVGSTFFFTLARLDSDDAS